MSHSHTSRQNSVNEHCMLARVPTPPGESWIFFLKIPGPGKSWKNILEDYAFFIGSYGKQAEIVNVPVCVDFYLSS